MLSKCPRPSRSQPMPISATCAACGSSFRVPDEHAGKRATCMNCGEMLSIPASDAPADLPSPWREAEDEIKEGAAYERERRARRREGGTALKRARKVLAAKDFFFSFLD